MQEFNDDNKGAKDMNAQDLEQSVWNLGTEQNNADTENIDQMSPLEIVEAFIHEDKKIIPAIALDKEDIALGIETIAESFRAGGRLIYFGAGTSGRLGILDASEAPPTFGTDPEMVQGRIAGGPKAITQAIEAAEDSEATGAKEVLDLNVDEKDTIVGITASGRTPYVIGAVKEANKLGASTIGVASNQDAELSNFVDIAITPVSGPELIQGSTRLKAGTATKMVLNILSTGAMIRIGKVYGNRMVDMKPTNDKLKVRSVRQTMDITGEDKETVLPYLKACDYHVKTAVLCILGEVDVKTAQALLKKNKGFLRNAIAEAQARK